MPGVTWKEISRENLVAAKSLVLDARWRSSVSRAYYAAYAAVAGELDGLAAYPRGRFGPSHDLLPQIVVTYLTNLRLHDRRTIAAAARRLYRYRIAADYEPPRTVGQTEATESIRDASFVMRKIANG
jgi:uncharacterized protein (UPF0332 family)